MAKILKKQKISKKHLDELLEYNGRFKTKPLNRTDIIFLAVELKEARQTILKLEKDIKAKQHLLNEFNDLKKDVNNLRTTGEQLSNVAFNYGQESVGNISLTDQDKKLLRDLQKMWDKNDLELNKYF